MRPSRELAEPEAAKAASSRYASAATATRLHRCRAAAASLAVTARLRRKAVQPTNEHPRSRAAGGVASNGTAHPKVATCC
eukprot:scaffold2664_cov319-Prasinococcus_capsulatus_cf.AAC.3